MSIVCPVVWKRYCDFFDTDILSMLPHHRSILKSIVDSWDSNIPNLLLYGAAGMPFFPIINYLILSPLSRHMKDISFQHSTFTHKTLHMPYTETDIYLYMDMMNPDMPKDGDAIFEFLITILHSRCMHLHKHIVVLDNIDVLTASSSQVMRVLLERYSSNVWFVCTTNRIGAIEPPIISRFLTIRIPLPTKDEVSTIIRYLGLPQPPIATRNLSEAIMGENAPRLELQINSVTPTLENVRLQAQRLLQNYVPLSQLAFYLINKAPQKKRPYLLKRIATIEAQYQTRRKGRDIFFYEAMLLS